MRAVIAVGRVGDIAPAIADAGGDDAGDFADQICHRFASPDHRLIQHQAEIRKLTYSSGTDALVI
jgi:hypothetical protein